MPAVHPGQTDPRVAPHLPPPAPQAEPCRRAPLPCHARPTAAYTHWMPPMSIPRASSRGSPPHAPNMAQPTGQPGQPALFPRSFHTPHARSIRLTRLACVHAYSCYARNTAYRRRTTMCYWLNAALRCPCAIRGALQRSGPRPPGQHRGGWHPEPRHGAGGLLAAAGGHRVQPGTTYRHAGKHGFGQRDIRYVLVPVSGMCAGAGTCRYWDCCSSWPAASPYSTVFTSSVHRCLDDTWAPPRSFPSPSDPHMRAPLRLTSCNPSDAFWTHLMTEHSSEHCCCFNHPLAVLHAYINVAQPSNPGRNTT